VKAETTPARRQAWVNTLLLLAMMQFSSSAEVGSGVLPPAVSQN